MQPDLFRAASLPVGECSFWRNCADEVRQMVSQVEDAASISVLIRIAIDFDRLAARTDELNSRLRDNQRSRPKIDNGVRRQSA
jgi:hypothetical protein